MVERLVWDQEVAGSNPVTPTKCHTKCDTAGLITLSVSNVRCRCDSVAHDSSHQAAGIVQLIKFDFESRRLDYVYFSMRLLLYTCVFLLFAGIGPLPAQDAPLPSPAPQDPAATTPTPAPVAPPPQLIPPDILPPPDAALVPPAPNVPSIPQLDEGFKIGPVNQPAETRRLHAEWRKLRNRVENDPQIRAARVTAEKARTDLEKRKLLRRYYDLLYARMSALADPGLRPYLKDRKNEAVATLPQPRVRPETVPAPEKKP